MGYPTISKLLLILILPFLIVLFILNFTGFDDLFYQQKFSEYSVQKNIPEAISLHAKVMNFIKGASTEPPSEFNEREKQHLWDVKKIVSISTIMLYVFIILFIVLLIISAFILKVNNIIINFVGKVLIFGGFLTLILAAALFFFINSDFPAAFESFHQLFFAKGTYTFDPAKEIIVRLYPEQLFMDLGIKISKYTIAASVIIVIIGFYLLIGSKSKKNKNLQKLKK